VIVAPAVDLREGRCVQLVGGKLRDERISLPDPVHQARKWWDRGFGTLHVVDLDAALSRGDNRGIIEKIVQVSPATIQVGGGIRDSTAVQGLLELGAHRVIVGTRAIEDPLWLEAMAREHPDRILVAADTRRDKVVKKGWTESSEIPVLELLDRLESLDLAGILWTDVSREGRMEGADMTEARRIVEGTSHPVWISGGVATLEQLRTLAEAGAFGVVVGMALYTEELSPEAVAREFGR
jgi:phosphoribosylformimino-5-aminoimidazole carboxamide ribotide isomerase